VTVPNYPADGGDQQAQPEGGQEIGHRQRHQQDPRAAHGDVEPEGGDEEDEDHVHQPHEGAGDQFACDELPRLDRGDDDLLHGARLPLLDDGQRGEHHRHHHEQEPQHPDWSETEIQKEIARRILSGAA
jgi:hypothetical protein